MHAKGFLVHTAECESKIIAGDKQQTTQQQRCDVTQVFNVHYDSKSK